METRNICHGRISLRVFRVFFRRKAREKVRESRRKFETVRDSLRKLKKVCEIMKTIWILDMDGPGERRGYQPSSTFFNLLDSTSYRVEGWGDPEGSSRALGYLPLECVASRVQKVEEGWRRLKKVGEG